MTLRIGLAPLAGVSDLAFRELCFDQGADFAVTEMVSAKGLYYANDKTETLLQSSTKERSLICQLFGHEPEIFRKVITEHLNRREEFYAIDLNMGCPAPKIIRNGDGSALMKNPLLAAQVIRAMVESSQREVSVKFRLGFTESHKNFLEIGHICQEEGACRVMLHGRTTEAMYSGKADWEAIQELKESLRIPVYGNGDITTAEDCLRRAEQSGVDGIAIGRGAMGNPFLFHQIKDLLAGEKPKGVSSEDLKAMISRHYETALHYKGEKVALLEMRKHLAWYLSGIRNSASVKTQIFQASGYREVQTILHRFFDQLDPKQLLSKGLSSASHQKNK